MLAMLRQPDLPPESVDQLSKNPAAVRSRKVRLAILEHPRTPRHVSIPLISGLFTFDLMQLALIPRAPADVKKLAERSLVRRLPKISAGERLSLARRASREVAGALLLDSEKRTVAAALNNPRMTEASVIQAVNAPAASPELIALVCRHAVWPLRREVRIALLRCQHTPLARALEYAQAFPVGLMREILRTSRLAQGTKNCILQSREGRGKAARRA
jgi:hypothetical protein